MKSGTTGRLNYYIHSGALCCLQVAKYLRSALIVTTLWMGTIGFIDDYIKIFKRQARIKGF
jgi:UDP-N-acetylmuramyl pentapeptide phosphotransferase/UDP-N-acetylglucosamine-1-phosphate transferase